MSHSPALAIYRYEGGTFPRKKENQRFRIPSNQSVTSKGSGIKISNGSIDYCSGGEQRASPMPTFQVQILKQGRVSSANKRNSLPEYGERSKPNIGELRYVHIDKSEMPLGIKIRCRNNGGGVFVSNVGENSIARQVSFFFNFIFDSIQMKSDIFFRF
jgi:discs large protein 5